MKNITKVGLSALAGALAITSVNAGEMSMSGSMEASYTKGSGYKTTGNPLGKMPPCYQTLTFHLR